MNAAQSLQSQSRWRLTNKTVLNLTAQRIIPKSKYQRGQVCENFKKLKGKQLSGSRESIRQFVYNKLKWRCFKWQKIPRLSAEYKKRRVNFAKKYKDMDWSQVMFTEESPFKLYHIPNSKNHVAWGSQEHSLPRAPQMKFSPTVLVWGAITARGLTKLHIIPQKTSVNSSYYISEMLKKEVKPAFSHAATSTDLTATKLFWAIVMDGFNRTVLVRTH